MGACPPVMERYPSWLKGTVLKTVRRQWCRAWVRIPLAPFYRSFGNGKCHNYDYHNGINNLFKIILYSYSNVFNILWKTMILINNMLQGFKTIMFNMVPKENYTLVVYPDGFRTIMFNITTNVWDFYRILIPKERKNWQNKHDSKFRSY